MITFSQTALEEIERLRKQHGQPQESKLLIETTCGGCMEWYYTLSFSSNTDSEVLALNSGGIDVVVPTSSQANLTGLHIDYSEDLMGGGFRFTNPNAVQTCGCGNSFSTTARVATSPSQVCTGNTP